MADPDLKPIPRAIPVGVILQTASAQLAVDTTVAATLPVLATLLTVAIVTAAGFLIITASMAGMASTALRIAMVIEVDGVRIIGTSSRTLNSLAALPTAVRVPVAAGPHTVLLRVGVSVALATWSVNPVTNPDMESASLVVMEASG